MEQVVVTGHTGFIGKKLVVGLEEAGFEVIRMDRNFTPVKCDRVYHLACPSSTFDTFSRTLYVMDTILDATRLAIKICPTAKFINASSMGAVDVVEGAQEAYNIAKRCMEIYLQQSDINLINYRIPSTYGEGMADDNFIKRCVDGKAYMPTQPDKIYGIAHVDEVVDAMINLRPINVEEITLGKIYELFNFGRRGLHRPASDQSTV